MNRESGKCLKIASRWDCIICNLRCEDRAAPFDVEIWRKSVK